MVVHGWAEWSRRRRALTMHDYGEQSTVVHARASAAPAACRIEGIHRGCVAQLCGLRWLRFCSAKGEGRRAVPKGGGRAGGLAEWSRRRRALGSSVRRRV